MAKTPGRLAVLREDVRAQRLTHRLSRGDHPVMRRIVQQVPFCGNPCGTCTSMKKQIYICEKSIHRIMRLHMVGPGTWLCREQLITVVRACLQSAASSLQPRSLTLQPPASSLQSSLQQPPAYASSLQPPAAASRLQPRLRPTEPPATSLRPPALPPLTLRSSLQHPAPAFATSLARTLLTRWPISLE